MLTGKCLWATDVRFLNDSNEFEHVLNIVHAFSSKMFSHDDYLERFAYQVLYTVQNLYAENLFVTSFSERADLLSQWRGYCPGGGGVCVGFAKDKISAFCEERGYRLEQCVYDTNMQVKNIETILNGCYARFPIHPLSREEFEALDSKKKVDSLLSYSTFVMEGPGKDQAAIAMKRLRDELSDLAPRCKDNGFHEESEWRLVAQEPKEEVKFRVSANATYVIPYVELSVLADARAEALQEIIVGPNSNKARCTLSIRQLLAAQGINHVDVIESKIPFNNW
jgi:hypothetical protein